MDAEKSINFEHLPSFLQQKQISNCKWKKSTNYFNQLLGKYTALHLWTLK